MAEETTAPSTNGQEVAAKIDSELEAKHKTLTLLTHGAKCTATNDGKFECSFPFCKAGKTMLFHVSICHLPPGSCAVPFCAMAKHVLAKSSEIQVQMAKANKRGRAFQRTLLSNHRAMTASVQRTRSRSTSRGPQTRGRPLTTVYESNDEEDGDDTNRSYCDEEDNRSPSHGVATSGNVPTITSPLKGRCSDTSATADLDSSEDDSSEEEEEDICNKPAPIASFRTRPNITWLKQQSREDYSEDSDSSDDGFGAPGTLTKLNVVDRDDGETSSDDDGFGTPGNPLDRKRDAKCEVDSDSSSEDASDGEVFGVPGTSYLGSKNKDGNHDNMENKEILAIKTLEDKPEPKLSANDEGDGWSSDEEEELKAALANRDVELAQQLMHKEECTEPSSTISRAPVPSDTTAESELNTETTKKPETLDTPIDITGEREDGAFRITQKDAQATRSLQDSENAVPENSAPSGNQSKDDGWSSEEDEELKIALANRDVDKARQLLNQNENIASGDDDSRKEFQTKAEQFSIEEEEKNFSDAILDAALVETKVGKEYREDERKASETYNNNTATTSVVASDENEGSVKILLREDNQQISNSNDYSDKRIKEGGEETLKGAKKSTFPEEVEITEEKNEKERNEASVGPIATVETVTETAILPDEGMGYQEDKILDELAVFQPVSYKGSVGKLTLNSECLHFHEAAENDTSQDMERKISWTSVSKHLASPPKVEKALLKVTLMDGKSLIFGVECRAILEELQNEVKRRLEHTSSGDYPGKSFEKLGTPPLTFDSIRFKSTVGSLELQKDGLVFKPGVKKKQETEISKLMLSWIEISKHQVSPATHAKALLRLTLTSGKSLTFEFKHRDALAQAKKEMSSLWSSFRAEAPTDETGVPAQSEYNAIFRSMTGSMVFVKEHLIYTPTESTAGASGEGVQFILSWEEVSKHKISPATHEKHLLKFLLVSGKSLTFELRNRVELVKARKEITQLLQDYQAEKPLDDEAG